LKQTSQQSKFRVEQPARKHRQLTVRICVALFLVGFALTTLFMRSSSALGRVFAAEGGNTAGSVSILNAEGTLQTADQVSATPSPAGGTTPLATETQTDTATPSAGEETTPSPTPDPSPTAEQPTEVREVSFQRESDGVQVRVNTQLPLPVEAALTLSLSRMTAEGDAAAYEPYRTLLANAVSPEQAQNYIAYELNYAVDGNEISPTQSAADLSLRDRT